MTTDEGVEDADLRLAVVLDKFGHSFDEMMSKIPANANEAFVAGLRLGVDFMKDLFVETIKTMAK